MERHEMREFLLGLDPADRFPLWVISYKRPGTAPFLDMTKGWATAGDVNVLVRESQADDYRAAYPDLNIVSQPDDEIGNCGSARWRAGQLARQSGATSALMFDDDVLTLRFMFQGAFGKGPNAGKEKTAYSLAEDKALIPDLEERVLAGMTYVARRVFDENPRAVTGGNIKQHMSFSEKNHQTMYILNGGVTPRQALVWNLERMEQFGIELDLDLFGVHGEDIGMAAEVLKAGADCFAMPSFCYDHWPESVNIVKSSIRNAENAARLHAEEWEALQRYPIKDYLRVKRSIIDGSYEWGDVNWQALHKLRGTKTQRVAWDIQDDLLI